MTVGKKSVTHWAVCGLYYRGYTQVSLSTNTKSDKVMDSDESVQRGEQTD